MGTANLRRSRTPDTDTKLPGLHATASSTKQSHYQGEPQHRGTALTDPVADIKQTARSCPRVIRPVPGIPPADRDSGIVIEMDALSAPGLNGPFEEAIDDALRSLPAGLRAAMSNVEIVVEDEPPNGQPLLGLYRGVPLPRRTSTYSGVLPDRISIFRGPIMRLAAADADRLRREVRHVVLHELAHHFGISDERLVELDRY